MKFKNLIISETFTGPLFLKKGGIIRVQYRYIEYKESSYLFYIISTFFKSYYIQTNNTNQYIDLPNNILSYSDNYFPGKSNSIISFQIPKDIDDDDDDRKI